MDSKGRKAQKSAKNRRGETASPRPERTGNNWLYGTHAVLAALANKNRHCQRLLVTKGSERALEKELTEFLSVRNDLEKAELARSDEISALFPENAVHQGIALRCAPLSEPAIEDLIAAATGNESATVVVLDQVTDPHNVGAILRSAAAFGAIGVITTERHAPDVTAVLAKAASGGLEAVPISRVGNLSRSLAILKEAGFWCIGLAAEATSTLPEAGLSGKTALVLGAEGKGLRRLSAETCDLLVRIPFAPASGHVTSLNVSNAAAVALYELTRETSRAAPPSAPSAKE